MSSATVYRTPTDSLRLAFMESLATDLRALGHEVTVEDGSSSVRFVFQPRTFSSADVARIYKNIRDRQLQGERDFIVTMEERGIDELFIDGDQVNIDAIRPRIQICQTQEEKDVYRYCRQLQSVPNSAGVGRRFCALVYDDGQASPVLMGVLGLAGTSYNQGDRDRYLGWSDIDSRSEQRARRHAGLRRLMQLAVFMAVPPYNELHGAKLTAVLALSDPIQRYYGSRYEGDPLLGLVTTVATRQDHCPVLNRIQLSRLPGAERYVRSQPSNMYVRIGSTSEYTMVMLTEDTVEVARTLVEAAASTVSDGSQGGIRSANSKGRVIPRALRLCGIARDVLFVNRKAVYFGYLHTANKQLLSDFRCGESPMLTLPVDEAVTYWRKTWCAKAMADRDRMAAVRAFRRTTNLLSKDPAFQSS